MAKIFDIGGKRVAFGLRWRMLDGIDGERNEIAGMSSDVGSPFHVLLKHDGEAICGFIPKESLPKKDKSAIFSGAAAFALQSEGNAMLLYQLDDACVMVVVKNGLVLQGQDRVGDLQEIIAAAKDFLGQFTGNIEVYGNLELDTPDCQPFDIESLEFGDESHIKKFRQQIVSNQMLGVLVIGLAFGGYLWYEDYSKAQQAKMAQSQQADPNALYQQNLAAELAKAGPTVGSVLDSWWGGIRAIPLVVNGWQLSGVSCAGGAQCQAQWIAIDKWTVPATGLDDLGKSSVSYSPDGKTAAYVLEPTQGQSAKTLLDASSIQQDIMIKTKSMGVSAQVRANGGEFQVQPATIFALPAGVPDSKITNPVRSGEWSFSGKAWMTDLLKVGLPDAFRVESLELAVANGEPTLKMKGHYYVR